MQLAKRKTPDLLNGPILKNLIAYAIPIMLTGLLQLAFNAADLMVVGQYCDEIAVGAVGNTGSITSLIVNFFMGLSVGAGVTVAQGIGAKDDEAVSKAVHTTVPLAILCSIVITFIGIFFCETFLEWMETPITVLPLSAKYMRIYFAGTIFIMIYNFCAAILRAAGDTKSPLIYLMIAGVINVVLNVIFIIYFHMDVDGVAWATTISQGISAILVVIALMRRKDACRLFIKKLKIHMEPLWKIFKIGMPAGIQTSLFAISNVVIQSAINSFGSTFMSACAAATNIESFMSITATSFHQAALNFIGQNIGANKHKRVKKIFIVSLVCVLIGSILLAIALYIVGPKWLTVYLPDSPEAMEWAIMKLFFMCNWYFLVGLMEVSTGALRGMGISFLPMIISILGVCGMRILWANTIFLIPRFHTEQFLFYCYPISWGVTFIAQTVTFIFAYRKRKLNHPEAV